MVDPDADQVTRKVVTLGQPMKRFAAQKFLGELTLELDSGGSVSRQLL
jgi:hypothetical protein